MYSVQSSNLKKNSSKKQKTNIKSSKLQWQSCPWWVIINCQGKAADPLSRWFTGSILSFLSPVCIEVDTCNCPYMWREMYFTGVFTLFGTFILWRPFIPSWKEKKVKNTCKVLDLITWDFPLAFALFFFGLTASIFSVCSCPHQLFYSSDHSHKQLTEEFPGGNDADHLKTADHLSSHYRWSKYTKNNRRPLAGTNSEVFPVISTPWLVVLTR